jgi:hypothetical protein
MVQGWSAGKQKRSVMTNLKRVYEISQGKPFILVKPVKGRITSCCIFVKDIKKDTSAVVVKAQPNSSFKVVGALISKQTIPPDSLVYEIPVEEALLGTDSEGTEILAVYNPEQVWVA